MASITFQSGEWIEYPFFNAFTDARDVLDMAEAKYIKYYDKHTAPTEIDKWIYSPFFNYKDGDYESVHYIANWEGMERRFSLSICEKEVL